MDTIPKIQDDRTTAQRCTHTVGVMGKDKFLSSFGPGKAMGGSWAIWACEPQHWQTVTDWVKSRSDMRNVHEVSLRTTLRRDTNRRDRLPRVRGLLHVYVVDEGHPALTGGRK